MKRADRESDVRRVYTTQKMTKKRQFQIWQTPKREAAESKDAESLRRLFEKFLVSLSQTFPSVSFLTNCSLSHCLIIVKTPFLFFGLVLNHFNQSEWFFALVCTPS